MLKKKCVFYTNVEYAFFIRIIDVNVYSYN